MSLLTILAVANAVLGLSLFEYCYYNLRRIRDPSTDALSSRYPSYRRTDVQDWARWKFWPGAMTIMFPRFFFMVIICSIHGVIINIFLIGHDCEKPQTGWRKTLVRFLYWLDVNLLLFFTFFSISTTIYEKDVDYSKWLGPEVGMRTASGAERASTIVCNHIGWYEIAAMIVSPIQPSFSPKEDLKNWPILGPCINGLQSIWIPRNGNIDDRDKVLEKIKTR